MNISALGKEFEGAVHQSTSFAVGIALASRGLDSEHIEEAQPLTITKYFRQAVRNDVFNRMQTVLALMPEETRGNLSAANIWLTETLDGPEGQQAIESSLKSDERVTLTFEPSVE